MAPALGSSSSRSARGLERAGQTLLATLSLRQRRRRRPEAGSGTEAQRPRTLGCEDYPSSDCLAGWSRGEGRSRRGAGVRGRRRSG